MPIVENVIKILRKMITLRSKQNISQDKNKFYIKLFEQCLDSYNKIRKQSSGKFTPLEIISLDRNPFDPWSVSNKYPGFKPEKNDIREIGKKLKIAKQRYPLGTIVKVRRIKGLVQKKSRQSFWSEKNYLITGNLIFLHSTMYCNDTILGYKVSPFKYDDIGLKLQEKGNKQQLRGVFYTQDIKVLKKP